MCVPQSTSVPVTQAGINLPIVGGIIAGAILLVFLCIGVAVLCRQRARARENTLKLTMKLTGMQEDQEPLTPTSAVPDMSQLRLIKVCYMSAGNTG